MPRKVRKECDWCNRTGKRECTHCSKNAKGKEFNKDTGEYKDCFYCVGWQPMPTGINGLTPHQPGWNKCASCDGKGYTESWEED